MDQPKVIAIQVVSVNGLDKVRLTLDALEGVWPHKALAHAWVDVTAGLGADWARVYYPGIPIKIVDLREG